MATQRVLDKYVTKEFLQNKCKSCDENQMRRKSDREKQEVAQSDSMTRELQNIHSAISDQGAELSKLGKVVANIAGRLNINVDLSA